MKRINKQQFEACKAQPTDEELVSLIREVWLAFPYWVESTVMPHVLAPQSNGHLRCHASSQEKVSVASGFRPCVWVVPILGAERDYHSQSGLHLRSTPDEGHSSRSPAEWLRLTLRNTRPRRAVEGLSNQPSPGWMPVRPRDTKKEGTRISGAGWKAKAKEGLSVRWREAPRCQGMGAPGPFLEVPGSSEVAPKQR